MLLCPNSADVHGYTRKHTVVWAGKREGTRTDRHGGTDGSPCTGVAPTHTHKRHTGFVIDPPISGIRYFFAHFAYGFC